MPTPGTTIERSNYTFIEKDVKDDRNEVTLLFKETKTLDDIKAVEVNLLD